jgi:hypothetical protein
VPAPLAYSHSFLDLEQPLLPLLLLPSFLLLPSLLV